MSQSIAGRQGDFVAGHTAERAASSPAYQAYQILHVAFVVAPVLAGLDKFFHLLVNWDMYLAPTIANLSPVGGHGLMLAIGVIEIIAGLLVALKPLFLFRPMRASPGVIPTRARSPFRAITC